MKNKKILAFGEAMLEFNQRVDDPRYYLEGFGGDTSNFAIAAARQGADSGYITAIGDDLGGQRLQALWVAEGVDTHGVTVQPGNMTGVYFVTHDAAGHHFNYLRQGSAASRYTPAQLPLDMIAEAAVLHLSVISLAISESACDSALTAMAHARQHSTLTSLDTNLRLRLWPLERARIKMAEAFAMCDICLPSWDDISTLTGLDDRDAIIDKLLEYGVKLVAFKLGQEGCYIATPNERRLVAPYPVEAIDATGAGDCFGGAFIARLVAGADPFEAARYANVAAALSTTGYGAVAPVPDAATVQALLSGSTA